MGEAVEHFSYDKVGNRLTDAKTGTNTWSYNQNNELQSFDNTSFKYNLNGQMTEKTVNGQKTTYSYNLDNRLSEIKDNTGKTIATYQYDPFGRRTSKTLPKESKIIYFYYNDEGLIAEYDSQGNLIQGYGYRPKSIYTTNPLFSSRPDFTDKAKGGYVYYIKDHLGTPQKIITETGRKVWEAQMDAFGKTTIINDEFTNILSLPGQCRDQESGLNYNLKRYYDPQLGRYITNDPIDLMGGINTYGYAFQSPTNLMDPYGTCPLGGALCVPAGLALLGTGLTIGAVNSRNQSNPYGDGRGFEWPWSDDDPMNLPSSPSQATSNDDGDGRTQTLPQDTTLEQCPEKQDNCKIMSAKPRVLPGYHLCTYIVFHLINYT